MTDTILMHIFKIDHSFWRVHESMAEYLTFIHSEGHERGSDEQFERV